MAELYQSLGEAPVPRPRFPFFRFFQFLTCLFFFFPLFSRPQQRSILGLQDRHEAQTPAEGPLL